MVSVDLKDAFFPVSVHKSHQKYFEWFRGFYKFIGMPNGYSEAMRILTKIFGPSLWIPQARWSLLSHIC